MPGQLRTPFEGSHFSVDLGTGDDKAFSRVELPVATLDEVAHRSGSDRTAEATKAPGLARYSHLVLHRALTTDLDLWHWWVAARSGARDVDRTVRVRVLNEALEPVLTWTFRNAFPVVHRVAVLDAGSSDVVVETLELAFDSMDVEA